MRKVYMDSYGNIILEGLNDDILEKVGDYENDTDFEKEELLRYINTQKFEKHFVPRIKKGDIIDVEFEKLEPSVQDIAKMYIDKHEKVI